MKKEMMEGNPKVMPEIIQEIMQYVMGYQPDEQILTLADNFLACSKQDLNACKILFKNKQFSQSTYHLQQTVEKASKAFVLYWAKFDKRDIMTIKHNSVNAFVMLLDKMSDYVGKINKMYPDLKTDASDIRSLVKDNNKRIELAKTDYEIYRVMFKLFDDCKIALKDGLNNVQGLLAPYNISKTLRLALKDSPFNDTDKLLKGKNNAKILKEYYDHDRVLDFLYENLDYCLLYTIAGLTFPHEQYTRYPDKEIKPSDYTENMGVVKATPELITHMGRIINNIEKTFGK